MGPPGHAGADAAATARQREPRVETTTASALEALLFAPSKRAVLFGMPWLFVVDMSNVVLLCLLLQQINVWPVEC